MRKEHNNRSQLDISQHQYLAVLVEQKKFADAVKYFEHHKEDFDSIESKLSASVFYLAAQAYASTSHFQVALKTARIAQYRAVESSNFDLQAEIFLTIGKILCSLNELEEAKKAYRDAESIFRRNDNIEGQSRALNILAGLFFKQNDYKNSLSTLMDAIEIARKLNDKKKLSFMMGNIGRIQTFIGNFQDAKKHLKINIELSSELNDSLEAARAYLSLGYIYLQEADYSEAEKTFDLANPLIVESKSDYDEVIYQTYLGELYYRTNRFEDSEEILAKALQNANVVAPDSSLTGRVLRHLAELNLLTGKINNASRLCSKAWVIMEKADEKVELGSLTKIKAVIAQKQNKADECRKLFVKAIDMLAETRVRFEKADALMAAGSSIHFSIRQRLTYLFRAEEYYSRFNLTAKLNKVEKLINQIEPIQKSSSRVVPTETGVYSEDVDYLTANKEIILFKKQLPLLGYTDLPVLLIGETGVGKDHMARFFHEVVRPGKPYVAINCASLPETLLESELFGYQRGAFTGAYSEKQGLFVAANEGVLFLDEIGDMPLHLQTKLLGVLESRQVTPLGSTRPVKLDIKLIAATNQALEKMVEEGKFRRDLFYRLSGLTFEIPPLRKRKEDIPLQMKYFMSRCSLTFEGNSLPSDLIRQFIEYDWPGNTRELFNKIKRLELMTQMAAEGDLIELSRSMFKPDEISGSNTLFERVEQFERKLITEALLAAGGNKSEAARMLGIHEATVRTKLKRYEIDVNSILQN